MPYLNTIASIKGGRDAATTVMPLISAALYLVQAFCSRKHQALSAVKG